MAEDAAELAKYDCRFAVGAMEKKGKVQINAADRDAYCETLWVRLRACAFELLVPQRLLIDPQDYRWLGRPSWLPHRVV